MHTKPIACLTILFLSLQTLAAQSTTPTAPAVSEQRLSMDYPDTEISAVLRDIADRCELNLIVPESLRGKTSLKLRDVTWKQAFKVILTPVGYTYIEDGQIVKVLPLEGTIPSCSNKTLSSDSALFELSLWSTILVCLVGVVFAICHITLSIGVLRDAPAEGVRFAPKFIWALFVLAGGVVPLIGYWLIHHSNLAKKG